MKLIAAIIVLVWLFATSAAAQSELTFLTSWKAYNFIPPGFNGKAMPLSRGTTIDVAFEVLENGKIVDISRNTVKFFVNGRKRQEGNGLRRFRFITLDGKSAQEIKIVVLNARGDVRFENRFTIPTVSPEVAIYPPRTQNIIEKGLNSFQAIPYFFNIARINDLNFIWTVNGVSPSEATAAPDRLELTVPQDYPSGASITLNVVGQNIVNPLETANQKVIFTVK